MKGYLAAKHLWGLCLLLLTIFPPVSAQEASRSAVSDTSTSTARGAKLAFSIDGRVLHVVGENPAELSEDQHVRAITYDVATLAPTHIINLQTYTAVLSMTSDGTAAIVATDFESEKQAQLLLLHTETGRTQPIPRNWYDPQEVDGGDMAGLSGNGRLISIYSESGPDESPMTVTVYDWATKTLIARRMSDYISPGGSFGGGVTVDGAVEFENNQMGRKVVDLKTGKLIAWFGYLSVRSPDGAWMVEFPDLSMSESASKDVLVKDGANGLTRGKLDMQVPDDEIYGQMTGAFCGNTGRFVAASRRDVGVYTVPSGKLLMDFPASSWRDTSAGATDYVSVACSPTGTRVAILSGTRLTLHEVK